MTWKLTQFNSITLPAGTPQMPLSTGPSVNDTLPLLGGGVFDAAGTDHVAPRLPYELTYQAAQVSATSAALETALLALESMNGLRATLWRTLQDGTTQQWCTARLMGVSGTRQIQHKYHQPVELQFLILTRWYSATATTVVGTLSASTTTVTLPNTGNARVTDVTVTVRPLSGSAITELTIGRTGYTEFKYSGSIAASTSLVIDTGAWSVTNNSTEDYANFSLTANHKETPWLRLPRNASASSIDVSVTRVGGGASDSASFMYYPAWQ